MALLGSKNSRRKRGRRSTEEVKGLWDAGPCRGGRRGQERWVRKKFRGRPPTIFMEGGPRRALSESRCVRETPTRSPTMKKKKSKGTAALLNWTLSTGAEFSDQNNPPSRPPPFPGEGVTNHLQGSPGLYRHWRSGSEGGVGRDAQAPPVPRLCRPIARDDVAPGVLEHLWGK